MGLGTDLEGSGVQVKSFRGPGFRVKDFVFLFFCEKKSFGGPKKNKSH